MTVTLTIGIAMRTVPPYATDTAVTPRDVDRMGKPRVLLADDHTLLLEAFQKLLADDCEIVGAVSNGRALVTAAATLRPDVVVVDVTMPLLNGIDAARQIRQNDADVRIIFLTDERGPRPRGGSVSRRRVGLPVEAVGRVRTRHGDQRGDETPVGNITPLVTEGLVGSMLHGLDSRPPTLTPRQREIVQLVAEGRSMKEVGAILNIAPRTVAFHKYRIMEQLHLKSTAELIQFAIRHHIV